MTQLDAVGFHTRRRVEPRTIGSEIVSTSRPAQASRSEIHRHVEPDESRIEDLRRAQVARAIAVVLLECRPGVRVEQIQDVDGDVRARPPKLRILPNRMST